MAGEAEGLLPNRIDDGIMVLVIAHDERNSDTGIDQGFVFGNLHD